MKVPHDDNEAHNAKAMVYVAINLPEFQSRQIQKNLIRKYKHHYWLKV